jgi:methionyl-tRNA formyltransferase
MRVLFWGTPDYAVPSLHALIGEDHEVVGVVTQPDRPAGRGRELREPPVKTIARQETIPVFQPEQARDPHFAGIIRELRPEISVVIAYGQILSQDVLNMPTHGSINAHASLLPKLRGAAPINWAIANGDEMTGVTIMRMVPKMDAGPIIYQVEEPIGEAETASDLRVRLSEISAELLVEVLTMIDSREFTETQQDDSKATFAPRITREHARIDFTKDARSIANLIRGMDDDPGAWTLHRDAELKLFRPLVLESDGRNDKPGTILESDAVDAAHGMVVACGTGVIAIREIKPAGKRRMTSAEWLRGRGAAAGECLGA